MGNKKVDICVIGTGAAGGVMCKELSQAGFEVVALEVGPFRTPADFENDELGQAVRFYFLPDPQYYPNTLRTDPKEKAEPGFHVARNMGVGGSTLTYCALSWRYHESDFKVKSTDGTVAGASIEDWPFTYDELEPFYEKAEYEIGVSGLAGANPFDPPRKSPYPMPPLLPIGSGQMCIKGAKKLGLHPFPSPMAINTIWYDGRPPCVYCGFCGWYACMRAARGSTLNNVIPKALATGKCEIRPNCMVREIAVDEQGRAKAAIYLDPEGKEQAQEAKLFLLCGGAIESARLLLMSKSGKFPQGLANSGGLVGKNMMYHIQAQAEGVFPWPVNAFKGPFSTVCVHDFYETDIKRGFIRGGTIEGSTYRGPITFQWRRPPDEPLWGQRHKDFSREYFSHWMALLLHGEDLPQESSIIDLDPEVKDKYRLPVARITHKYHENDYKAANYIGARAREIMEAAGAIKTWGGELEELHGQSAHHMGTCRMGNDPSKSVLDRWCRAHDVPNLFVPDASCFVTSAGANPALTIQAIAFRTADYIIKSAKQLDL